MAHIISITDFDTPELDVYARLTENQLVNRADPANALFICWSAARRTSPSTPLRRRC